MLRIRAAYKRFVGTEQGASLLELMIFSVLLGITLPALVAVLMNFTQYQENNRLRSESTTLANSRMEEILAFKYRHWDWFKTIGDFSGKELLSGGYTRDTRVRTIKRWGKAEVRVIEVEVLVTHNGLPDDCRLVARLTQYD